MLILAIVYLYILLGILFLQITTFIKVCVVYIFWFQTLQTIDLTQIYQSKGLEPKNKGHMNFYECRDLMKKYMYYCIAC